MENPNYSRVVDCIARATRYPVDILQPQADLEIDLGIDSVKRLEVVVELEKEFGLDLSSQPRDSAVKTIQDVTDWVERMMGGQPAPSVQPPAPVETTLPNQNRTHPVSPVSYEQQPAVERSQFNPGTTGQQSIRVDNGQPGLHSAQSNLQSHSRADFAQQPQNAFVENRSLAGKIAFVTGSGRSVGKVIARVLASRGATVIVNSFHSRDAGEQTVAEINGSGGQAVHIWGSVASPAQVDGMFDEIESRFGRLDILVCNASDGRIGSFMDLKSDDWDRAFRTNVSGHHQCAVRASRLMQRVGGGAIVTMSAVGAHGYVDGLGSQGVVKAAVESLSRYLACELGKFGIRVNCVAGGPVYGELISKFPNAAIAQNHWESVAPDGNLTSPLDLANTIAFLVSDDARGVNGAVWTVDHGFSAMESGQPVPRAVSRVQQPTIH